MTRGDADRIQAMLRNHIHYTGSKRAHEILLNWEYYMPKFVKVMPVDYRRALEEMAQAQAPKAAAGGAGVSSRSSTVGGGR
ncbi:MAG: hypothetical protein NVV74_18150 [Magnetospirillum sp.]|nr:hypothetical protein [Magnetospirillum sp.]